MNKMKRFLIAGSRTFNNYYIMYRYLQRYLPGNAVICNGGANGADQLAKCYAECNGHIYEDYPAKWEKYGKSAGTIRNREMVKLIDHAIFFWDGKSPSTNELIEMCKKQNIVDLIIDITDDDLIKPHPTKVVNKYRDPYDIYIGRGEGSIWGNPFPITATRDRECVVSQFTDYLLKQPKLLEKLPELKNKVLGCYCAPNLCHGDMLVWLTEHALSEIKEMMNENKVDDTKAKQRLISWEELFEKYDKNGSRDNLYTKFDLQISRGYSTVVVDGRYCYLEISDKDICKENLWMSMDERKRVMDEDPVRIYYHVHDKTKTTVFFQQQGFPDSPFKTGRWYVRADDLQVRCPTCSDIK